MRTKSNAKTHQALGIVPEIIPASKWRIREVKTRPGHKLWIRFNDGTNGEVDLSEFLKSSESGVFSVLVDENEFRKVRLELGIVTWPGGLDMAPETLYREIKARIECPS
jgi:hypothetical protein